MARRRRASALLAVHPARAARRSAATFAFARQRGAENYRSASMLLLDTSHLAGLPFWNKVSVPGPDRMSKRFAGLARPSGCYRRWRRSPLPVVRTGVWLGSVVEDAW